MVRNDYTLIRSAMVLCHAVPCGEAGLVGRVIVALVAPNYQFTRILNLSLINRAHRLDSIS